MGNSLDCTPTRLIVENDLLYLVSLRFPLFSRDRMRLGQYRDIRRVHRESKRHKKHVQGGPGGKRRKVIDDRRLDDHTITCERGVNFDHAADEVRASENGLAI